MGFNIQAGLKAKNTKEFDEAITLPIHGYKTVREYYDSISCVHVLHNIQVPVFCLSCKDDPICIEECIPYDEIKNNPNIVLAVTRTGGHVGWYTGIRNPQRWYPIPVCEVLNFIHSGKIK